LDWQEGKNRRRAIGQDMSESVADAAGRTGNKPDI